MLYSSALQQSLLCAEIALASNNSAFRMIEILECKNLFLRL